MNKKTDKVQKFEYKAEMKQLLDLIVHSLYTHPEVFLRELISNASDALNKARSRGLTDKDIVDPDADLEIRIEVDPKARTFSIEDSGIGMTEEDLINDIGTVARSGTLEYLKTMKEQKKESSLEESLIGKFGVGFYSVFMVTDEVTIETRHADSGSKAYKWKSSGEGTFTIEETDKKTRGTKISFKIKDTSKEFSEEFKIKNIINKYSNFADFPIFLGEEKVNTVSALWRKNSKEIKEEELNEFYKFITNNIDDPLGHLHLSVEGTVVNFKALLFIPAKAPLDILRTNDEKGLHLYSNKILIQNDCRDLLPEYLRFVKGVIDTIDLPLNISREITQSSPLMGKIKDVLTAKTLAFLSDWAEKEKDKYITFHKNFGILLKTGFNEDIKNRDKIIDLMRFGSSMKKAGELVSLKDYVSRMKDDQKEIYYISGEHRDALERNPNLEYFKKNDIEVLLLTDPVDIFTVPSIFEYEKKTIKSANKADIEVADENTLEKPDEKLPASLVGLFKETLSDRVEDVVVSKRLVDSAATLVAPKEGMDPQMEKLMKLMNRDQSVASKKIMEINMEHPLIKNMSRMYIADSKDPLLKKCMIQLFESSLLIEGELPASMDFVQRMTEIMEDATGQKK